jgi:hypothetical protein
MLWKFDYLDRLDGAITRARAMEKHLLRDRCEAADLPLTLQLLDRRILATRRRIERLCERACVERLKLKRAGAVPAGA